MGKGRGRHLRAAHQEQEAGHGLDAVEGGHVGEVVKVVADVVLQEAHARALPARLPPKQTSHSGLLWSLGSPYPRVFPTLPWACCVAGKRTPARHLPACHVTS